MNTKSNLWCKSLAVLALSCALANTALGQAVQLQWSNPANITYGTPLSGTQLNAIAVDANGNDVTATGEITYFWNAPEATASEIATGDPKRSHQHVTPGVGPGYKLTDSRDRDGNGGNGIQEFDWLYLDAGDNQTLTAVFRTGGAAALTAQVDIDVKKANLSAVPSTLNRNFGEENFVGYESTRNPRYPDSDGKIGRFMFLLPRAANGDLEDGNNARIDARGFLFNNGVVTETQSANIVFALDGNGNRQLAKDNDANEAILDRTGAANLTIPVVGTADPTHFARTGSPITFSGFVRQENYVNLATANNSFASATEQAAQNNQAGPQAGSLVTSLLDLSVQDSDGDDIFRGAPVGTTGVISFSQAPAFKNYSVSTGANGTLTVTRAKIEFKAKLFTDDDNGGIIVDLDGDGKSDNAVTDGDGDNKHRRKIYGNGISARVNDPGSNIDIINDDIILSGSFALNNNFRLGEAFIEQLLDADAPGLSVSAPVGNSNILLFVDTTILGGVTGFLNNYDIQLTGGTVTTIAREFDLEAENKTKTYGAVNPPFSFLVDNPAPHQVKDNQVPVRQKINNPGDKGDVYRSNQLKDGFFGVTPVLASGAGITSNTGGHTITISDGAAANHALKNKSNGTLTITRANLLLQVGNFSSVVGGGLSSVSVTPFGLLPFDNLSGILTNNPQFAFVELGANPAANVGRSGDFVRQNEGEYRIVISNKTSVRANNYNVFFNDGFGSYDGIGDGLNVNNPNSDGLGGTDGQAFTAFTTVANSTVLTPPNFNTDPPLGYGPTNKLFNTGNNATGRYTTTGRQVIISWSPPSAVTFGNKLDGRLGASFINPDTGLLIGDNANGATKVLTLGADYNVRYTHVDSGRVLRDSAVNNAETYVLLEAGKSHKIRVDFILANAGNGTVANLGFGNASLTREILVNKRTIKIKPNKTEITFGNNIPNNGNFTFSYSDLPGGHYQTGILQNGNPIEPNVAGNTLQQTFVRIEVNEADRLFTTPATNTSNAGTYSLVASNFKAKNGNLNFTFEPGEFVIKKAPTTLSWSGDLAAITYGTRLGDAQLFASGPANVEGTVVYNKGAGTLLPAGNTTLEAEFVPADPNFDKSGKLQKTLTVERRPLTVQAENTSKVFGDDNPAFQATAESLSGLITEDASISLTFQTTATKTSDVRNGGYPIEPVLSDPDNKLSNYELTIGNATLTINKRAATITAADRSMQTETNPIPFLNDFINSNPANDTRPNNRVIFSNLAPIHAIANEKIQDNKPKGFDRVRALFPNLQLSTTATVNSPNDQSFPITIAQIGARNSTVQNNGETLPKVDGNYTFTVVNGTLSVTSKMANITWADVTITYGQAISKSGVKRADKDKDTRTQSVNLFDATATPSGGTFTYRIKGQGELLDGIIFPATNEIKLEAEWTPPASSPDFGKTVKEMKLKVAKRFLTIAILDQTNTYGEVNQNFQARYGEIRKNGENDGDYNGRQAKSPNRLVNGDTPESLDQQLVLFSNATATSGAGEYFIAVAQQAIDSNYDIQPVFGNHIFRDGITRDVNGVVLANVGNNISGIGGLTSFVGAQGDQITFDPSTGTPSTPVNFPANNPPGTATKGVREFHAGKLTINKAPLTITAGNLVKDQGAANPPFSAIANPDQLKNGDTLETLLKTQLIFVSGVDQSSPVGTFPISVTGASSDNYIITHRPGTFTVQPPQAPIGWTPNPSAIVYGSGLTSDQLNAASTVSGSFDYSANPIGTVLSAGSQTLSATFTPDDLTLHRVSTVTATLQVDQAPLSIRANDVNRGFMDVNPPFTVSIDGLVNGDTPAVLTAPVTFSTDGVAGATAGTYPLIPAGATANNYSISFVPGNITVSKATAVVTLSGLEQVADGTPRMVSVTTVPAGVNVDVTYNGRTDAPTESGTYEIRAIANDPNYNGFAIGTLTVSGTGVVSIANLTQTFSGSGLGATITTDPVGLGTQVTYNGSADLPVNAGTYEVRVVIDDPVFSGFAVDVLTIQPAEAEISFDLDSLSQPVNGLTGAVVNTVPAGLTTEIFYGDSTTIPSEIGSTLVRGVIDEPNWVGSVTSTFIVENATQSVTVPNLPEFEIEGDPLRIGLFATASSQLPVTFSVVSGNATVRNRTLTVTQPGDVVVRASQAGDDFWAPAEATFTVTVTGQGVPQAAPSLRVAGISNAGIEIAVTGAAGATVNIMGTDILPGGTFSSVGTVTLNGSGNGSLTVPVSGAAGYFKAANQ